MALGAPLDVGAELATLVAGLPAGPRSPVGGLARLFSAAELRALLEAERGTALLARHHAEADH